MSRVFLDTNLLLYAHDPRDLKKQQRAIVVLDQLTRAGMAVLSTQVLSEFAAAAISKFKLRVDVVLRELLLYENVSIIQVTTTVVRRAVELHSLHQISFWDGQIIAAAEQGGCPVVYSEDLNPGQLYGAVRVENPFL